MSEASAVGKACPMSGAQPMSAANALAEASAVGMEKLSMCFSRNDVMVQQQSVSIVKVRL